MLTAVARSVQPPDLSMRNRRAQLMKHREQRRRADTRAEQHYRSLTRPESEIPPRRTRFQNIANFHAIGQERASQSLNLLFYAHAVCARFWRARHRVVAPDRIRVRPGTESQHQELAGQGSRQRVFIRALE